MGASKSRKDMIETVAVKTAVPERTIKSILNALVEYIADKLSRGDEVHLMSLGRFWMKSAPKRDIMVPSTGKIHKVGARLIPKFSFGRVIGKIIRKETAKHIPMPGDGKDGSRVSKRR